MSDKRELSKQIERVIEHELRAEGFQVEDGSLVAVERHDYGNFSMSIRLDRLAEVITEELAPS